MSSVSTIISVVPHVNPVLMWSYILSNIIIVIGYVSLATFVVPATRFSRLSTKLGGLAFFLTCGLHHLHNMQHALSSPVYASISYGWQHVLIDVIQAIAVWVFTYGLIREVHYKEIPIKGRANV